MNWTAQLIDVDGELGIEIPQEVLNQWKVTVGDDLYVSPIENGFLLSPTPPATTKQRRIRRKKLRANQTRTDIA